MPKKAKRTTTKKGGGKGLGRYVSTYYRSPAPHKRIHVAAPSSASEILESLAISSADLRAALEAIDS